MYWPMLIQYFSKTDLKTIFFGLVRPYPANQITSLKTPYFILQFLILVLFRSVIPVLDQQMCKKLRLLICKTDNYIRHYLQWRSQLNHWSYNTLLSEQHLHFLNSIWVPFAGMAILYLQSDTYITSYTQYGSFTLAWQYSTTYNTAGLLTP